MRKGQSDRVRMSQTWDIGPGLLSRFSPEPRPVRKQKPNIHSIKENQPPLIRRPPCLRSGTIDRDKCPKSGTLIPVSLSLDKMETLIVF